MPLNADRIHLFVLLRDGKAEHTNLAAFTTVCVAASSSHFMAWSFPTAGAAPLTSHFPG